jgi:hypothetical protein
MRRVEAAQSAADVLQGLLQSSLSEVVETGDAAYASVRSFASTFRQIARTPEMIRIMLQPEFNFAGVVDASAMGAAEAAAALERDWWDATFVVIDYADAERWLLRCAREAAEGRTAVALVPARTNSAWFHELVLEGASEVRFVKGRVHFEGARPSGFPDALAVFRRHSRKRARAPGEFAVLHCARAFTEPPEDVAFGGGLALKDP